MLAGPMLRSTWARSTLGLPSGFSCRWKAASSSASCSLAEAWSAAVIFWAKRACCFCWLRSFLVCVAICCALCICCWSTCCVMAASYCDC